MTYRFVQEREDYSDFAGGQVFLSAAGQTGFPVRLASELFQRCLAFRRREGLPDRCTVYDPCCGSAYLLSTLVYLHGNEIGQVIGSDVESDVLRLAQRNLALTRPEGLAARIGELEELYRQFGKDSHAASVESAKRLRQKLADTRQVIPYRVFEADATRAEEIATGLGKIPVDIVLTDIPYGQLSSWRTDAETLIEPTPFIARMLEALHPILSAHSIVAIAADKSQKAAHPAYRRVEQFQVGKRRLTLLQLARTDS